MFFFYFLLLGSLCLQDSCLIHTRDGSWKLLAKSQKIKIFQAKKSRLVGQTISFCFQGFPPPLLIHAFTECCRRWENLGCTIFFLLWNEKKRKKKKTLARVECLLIPRIRHLTFSFCFSPPLIFTEPKVGVCPSSRAAIIPPSNNKGMPKGSSGDWNVPNPSLF